MIRKTLSRLLNLIPIQTNIKKIKKLIADGWLEIGLFTYQWEGLNIDFYAGSEAKIIIGKF